MKTLSKIALAACIWLSLASEGFAGTADTSKAGAIQISDSIVIVKMIDNTEFYGTIIFLDEKTIILKTGKIGDITLSRDKIASIKPVEEQNIVKGEVWHPNPDYTRYLFGPTGFGLKKGEGYYQNIYVFYNSLNFGFTDYFSLGIGSFLIGNFVDAYNINLSPKLSFDLSKDFHIGLGTYFWLVASMKENASGTFGINFGVLTYGNKNDNISIGGGFSYGNQDVSSSVVCSVSGMCRVSNNISLVSENWIFPSTKGNEFVYLLSYSVRLMGDRTSFDIGFINHPEIAKTIAIGIPYIDFIYKW